MNAGILDAIGLVRALQIGDQEGFLKVVQNLDEVECRQMVSRLAHLVLAARSVALGVPSEDWLSRMITQVSDTPT